MNEPKACFSDFVLFFAKIRLSSIETEKPESDEFAQELTGVTQVTNSRFYNFKYYL